MHYEDHPIAGIFPLLDDGELQTLADDIKAHGLEQPITLYEGKVLDGRNRIRACEMAGIEPTTRQYEGASPFTFIVSMNLVRRQLTKSQCSCCAMEVLPEFEKEANVRMLSGKAPDPTAKMQEGSGEAIEQAAAMFGVSPRYVYEAKKLKAEAPELFEAVKAGTISLTDACRQVTHANQRVNAALPSDKYRVLYADPPWRYNDRVIDTYGPAERHYPTMSIPELCALPIVDLADDNAVLFLWATSPFLEECFAVVEAWSFTYKTCFVWDKVKHNFGHYNSVRHELLLVCTRGSCTPDNPQLFDSVQSVERTDHSKKPEEFRTIIETLYPVGKRIELFARGEHPGWTPWP